MNLKSSHGAQPPRVPQHLGPAPSQPQQFFDWSHQESVQTVPLQELSVYFIEQGEKQRGVLFRIKVKVRGR